MYVPNADQKPKFLPQLNKILKQKIDDRDFSIDQLCKLMHLSRSSLHRKITAHTGKSISIYIRAFRLSKAYELLQIEDWPIRNIALAVGFRDIPYFCKCFKEKYGCTPSEVRIKD